MQYDRTITITVGASRRTTNWQPQTMRVSELYERLRLPACPCPKESKMT